MLALLPFDVPFLIFELVSRLVFAARQPDPVARVFFGKNRFWAEIAARFEEDALSAPACPDWMLRAIQTFENEEGLRAGFPQLLAKSHVSPGHLAREWQRVFEQTPTGWINERRLQTAAQLLLQTPLSIKEVAARCGFDSPLFSSHFRAPFRRDSQTLSFQTRCVFKSNQEPEFSRRLLAK